MELVVGDPGVGLPVPQPHIHIRPVRWQLLNRDAILRGRHDPVKDIFREGVVRRAQARADVQKEFLHVQSRTPDKGPGGTGKRTAHRRSNQPGVKCGTAALRGYLLSLGKYGLIE